MNEPVQYRISFVIRNKKTKEIIKDRILDENQTDKDKVLQLYFKYIKAFKEKITTEIEILKNHSLEYSVEILEGEKIILHTTIF